MFILVSPLRHWSAEGCGNDLDATKCQVYTLATDALFDAQVPHPGLQQVHLTVMVKTVFGREANTGYTDLRHADEHERLLDNPILNSLITDHSSIALIEGVARRYPPAVGPLAGVLDQSFTSYEALKVLASAGEILVLFFPEAAALPPGWSLVRGGLLTQMICRSPAFSAVEAVDQESATFRRLEGRDVAAMIELAKLTEPGPFRERTIELGGFYGIFEDDRLVAMAGQRLRVPGFVEVSAVCTHPDARGRGYASVLMQHVMREIIAEGRLPFLHAYADNPAVRLYQRLGFMHRRSFHLAVIRNEA